MARLTIKDCKKIAKKRGGKCLSQIYKNSMEKIEWICSKEHRWYASFNNIRHRSWCPLCSNNRRRTISEAIKLAKDKNGYCLSDSLLGAHNKLQWKCNKNHVWSASFHSVDCGSWCPECNVINRGIRSRLKNGLNIAKKIAFENNGKCLSEKYIGNNVKMLWECNNRHNWYATFSSIKNNKTWCPKCKMSQSQNLLLIKVNNIFPNMEIKYNYKKFNWLKTNNGGKQELDLYIPELKLAIEYDGEQHFKPINFGYSLKGNAIENFKLRKKLDKLKNKKIKEHPEDIKYFIRFNYKENITEKYIKEKLTKIGVNI